jgi:hypothetical protein
MLIFGKGENNALCALNFQRLCVCRSLVGFTDKERLIGEEAQSQVIKQKGFDL